MTTDTNATGPNGADEGLLARVRKLLAQAEDPAATEAEAEAFNTKAAELIARHGIDQAMLAAAGVTRDQITQRTVPVDNPYGRDKAHLLAAIAAALRAEAVLCGRGKSISKVIVFGFASDLDRIELLYTSLLIQATTQLSRIRPDHDPYFGRESTAAYRRSWFAGFTHAVYTRLVRAESAQAAEPSAASPGDTSTALVLRDRQSQVADAFKREFPKLRTAKQRQLSGSGYGDGRAAGARADLGTTRLGKQRDALTR